jgi:hypothetical protein
VSAVVWAVAAASVAAALAVLLRGRRTAAVLPLADARSLHGASRRSSVLWLALVATLAVLLALSAALAWSGTGSRPLLSPGSDAVVVVDVSSSTRSASNSIARILRGLTNDPRRRLGLVVFSNAAYEALPLSTPVEGLKGWLERFAAKTPRLHPWATFSSGTAISTGLVLARRLLLRAHVVKPHVVLVSDLDDAPSDVPMLQTVVAQYQRQAIDLRVVRVKRHSGSLRAPDLGFVEQAASTTVAAGSPDSGGAWLALGAVLAAAAALAAALHELAFHPFAWGTAT